jgi:DNA mismatch endonuclease, patch repair protein
MRPKKRQPDRLSREERSALMGRVRSKNTKPEIVIRRFVHGHGYRFRLHRKNLPGSPDLVFPSLKKAIFVHGCFWHRHEGCKMTTTPNTQKSFWHKKFNSNTQRDKKNISDLKEMGWSVFIVWECEAKNMPALGNKILTYLQS